MTEVLGTRPALITDDDPGRVLTAVEADGAVLLRRPGTMTLDGFVALSEALIRPMVYHGTNMVERDPVAGDVRTTTVNKGRDEIPLHREASYAPGAPDLLMFYCVTPADAGGQTTLCDGVQLFAELPAAVQAFVSKVDLYWRWTAPPDRWKQTLQASTRSEADVALERLRAGIRPWETLDVGFDGDVLHGVFRTPCVIPTRSGASFCNSLMSWENRAKSVYYPRDLLHASLADGSEFPRDTLAAIVDVSARLTVDVGWEPGDTLVVDNGRYLHGRRAFTDPGRRILVRMGYLRGAR